MKSYPFINLYFEEDKTNAILSKEYISNSTLKFDYKLLKGLDPSSNKVTFQIIKDCPLLEKIIASNKDIKAEISTENENGIKTRLFTGYISTKFSWGINDHGKEVLNLTVEDVGTRLLKKTYSENKSLVLKGKMTDVLNTICQSASIQRADNIVIDTQVCLVVEEGKKYEDVLKPLVKEVMYTYYFDEYGKLALEDLTFTDYNNYEINKTNLYSNKGKAVTLNKSIKQYGWAEVKWKEFVTMPNALIFKDTNGQDDAHPNCHIEVAGRSTYPSFDNGKPAKVEITDLDTGRDVVYFENLQPETLYAGDFTEDISQYDYKSLAIAITNNSSFTGTIVKLQARGDLTVVKSINTANSSKTGDYSFSPFKTESLWLHNVNDVKAYAEFLTNYYKYCNISYKFFTDKNMKLGDICRLQEETFSGLDVRLLLTEKRWTLDGLYEYTGVAISKFDILDVDNDGINKPSIKPGRPGPQGVSVNEVKYFYQVAESSIDPPSIWLEKIPEFTSKKRYLWSYFITYFSDGSQKESIPGVIGVLGIDGKAPVVVNPSFETMTISAKTTGEVSSADLSKIACEIAVSQDDVLLKYTEGPLTKSTFNIEIDSLDLTDLVIDSAGESPIIKPSSTSAMIRDVAVIRLKINYKDAYDRTGFIPLSITISKAKQGEDGQYTAIEYYASTSDKEQIGGEWLKEPPSLVSGKYLWIRTQVVPAGGEIDPANWSTPILTGGDFTSVVASVEDVNNKVTVNTSQIKQTADQIFLGIDRTTNEVTNSAGVKVGWLNEDQTAVQLDADSILLKGTVTADKIKVETLMGRDLELQPGGTIYSKGYKQYDIDKDGGQVDPDDPSRVVPTQGFYMDTDGYAEFRNIHTKAMHAVDADVSGRFEADSFKTVDKTPEISINNIKPEFQAGWTGTESQLDWVSHPGYNFEERDSQKWISDWRKVGNFYYMKNEVLHKTFRGTDPFNYPVEVKADMREASSYVDGKYWSSGTEGIYIWIYSSYDGDSWNLQKIERPSAPDVHRGSFIAGGPVYKVNNIYFILGTGPYWLYSRDSGRTWRNVANTSVDPNGTRVQNMVYFNGNYYVASNTGSYSGKCVNPFTSTDIEQFPVQADGKRPILSKLFVFNNMLVGFGGGDVYYSYDAVTWTKQHLRRGGNSLSGCGVGEDGKMYVGYQGYGTPPTINGSIYVDYTDIIYSSSNGINWEEVILPRNHKPKTFIRDYIVNKRGILVRDETTIFDLGYNVRPLCDYYSELKPKIDPSGYVPSSEPLRGLADVTGTVNIGGTTYNLAQLKVSPTKVDIHTTNGKVFNYSWDKPTYDNVKITSLTISPVDASIEFGNAVPRKQSDGTYNVDIGSEVLPFRHVWAKTLHGAISNDYSDSIEVDLIPEPGYCYCYDGERYYKSSKYLDDGIIGIHSDTYAINVGDQGIEKQLDVAVSGFVLAYTDKVYKPGTPLTCTKDGYLTEINMDDKVKYPEKIVGTFWKEEKDKIWKPKNIEVKGRNWIKIK